MKKFLFLYYGYETPTDKTMQETMDAWNEWFVSVDEMMDSGSRLGRGREITHTGVRELSPETGAPSGFSILSAEDIDDAVRTAKDCPIVTSVRVYEATSM